MSDRPDAETVYNALIGSPSRLRGLRRMQYRCESRCLLLDAVAVSGTILLHQRRYKTSVARYPGSRPGSTTFDSRHYRPRTAWSTGDRAIFYVPFVAGPQLPEPMPPRVADLHCDHADPQLTWRDFNADWDSGHAEITVRANGSRYAVA